MRTFSRRAAPPEQGWFQIGEVPPHTPPRRRGQGRVSLSASQHDPDAVEPEPLPQPKRPPALERANGVATTTLERIIEQRYGALALCVTALLLVLILAVMIATERSGEATAAVTAHVVHQQPRAKGTGQ